MSKPAIAYVRVSTEGQALEGVSLDAQRARVEAWCVANDFTLAAVYCDAGLSGKRADNRPELQRALDHVCKAGGVLVVYSLSRLARSTKDTLAIADRLQAADADLVSLSEKIDTLSASGKMLFRLLAVLAEFERDLIAERTTTAMQHKKARGERVGKIPFGYDLAANGVALVVNADEQAILADMAGQRGRGASYREIADDLTRRGVRTKEGKDAWQHTSIRRMLARVA